MNLEQAILAAAGRFWSHVDIGDSGSCWPWKLCRNADGYGRFSILHQPVLAHRVAFFLTYGRWPDPCALHGCDQPPCCNAVNVNHVHEGTQADNAAEKISRQRQAFQGRKLGDDQAAEIRRRAAEGELQRDLAREFGVAGNAISRIVLYRTYGTTIPVTRQPDGVIQTKGWKP